MCSISFLTFFPMFVKHQIKFCYMTLWNNSFSLFFLFLIFFFFQEKIYWLVTSSSLLLYLKMFLEKHVKENRSETYRSSHRRCYVKKLFLKTWQYSQEIFIKNRLHRKPFPVNIIKLLRTPNLKNICERLLLCMKVLHLFDISV